MKFKFLQIDQHEEELYHQCFLLQRIKYVFYIIKYSFQIKKGSNYLTLLDQHISKKKFNNFLKFFQRSEISKTLNCFNFLLK